MPFLKSKSKTIHVNARAIIERHNATGVEIVLQTRNKSHESAKTTELPGGRLDPYESLLDALKREVKEETGLDVTFIEGHTSRIESTSGDKKVECLRPYAVYQTLEGPVDSMGVYFLCHAEGTLLNVGDETENIMWLPVTQVATMLADNQEQFSWVDQAALKFYLTEKELI